MQTHCCTIVWPERVRECPLNLMNALSVAQPGQTSYRGLLLVIFVNSAPEKGREGFAVRVLPPGLRIVPGIFKQVFENLHIENLDLGVSQFIAEFITCYSAGSLGLNAVQLDCIYVKPVELRHRLVKHDLKFMIVFRVFIRVDKEEHLSKVLSTKQLTEHVVEQVAEKFSAPLCGKENCLGVVLRESPWEGNRYFRGDLCELAWSEGSATHGGCSFYSKSCPRTWVIQAPSAKNNYTIQSNFSHYLPA